MPPLNPSWDEQKHPRRGGKFAPKGQGDAGKQTGPESDHHYKRTRDPRTGELGPVKRKLRPLRDRVPKADLNGPGKTGNAGARAAQSRSATARASQIVVDVLSTSRTGAAHPATLIQALMKKGATRQAATAHVNRMLRDKMLHKVPGGLAVRKKRQMQFSAWHAAIRQVQFEAPVIPKNFKITNPEPGVWVVHDVPVFYECVRDGDHYDDSWLRRAFENAKQAEVDGHLAPLHVHHRFRPDHQAFAAGTMRVTGIRKTTYKGRPTLACFYDLIVTREHVAREISENKLLWRSPEVSFNEARIVSLALLDHEAPFFEGPMTTVQGDVPDGSSVPIFQFALEGTSPVIAFSRSNGLTRTLFRCESNMTYPIKTSPADPKKEEPEVKQMGDGQDAPGGSAAPGSGQDAPGGTDKKKPDGAEGGEKPAESKGDGAPTQMGDDDKDMPPAPDAGDETPQPEGGDDGDQGLEGLDVGDDGQPAGNELLDALQTTPATLEQCLEALGFLQDLVNRMKGVGGDQLPPSSEGPMDQMSTKPDDIQQFEKRLAKQQGEIDGLRQAAEDRQKADEVRAFASEAVKKFAGSNIGQDPELEGKLVKFASEHGVEAAKEYVAGLEAARVPLANFSGKDPLKAIAGDDVPDELKHFANDSPERYEQARRLHPVWSQLQAKGICRDIDFQTFVKREREPVTTTFERED